MLLLDVFPFAAAWPNNVKCPAVKTQIAARQSKKSAVRTQNRLFLFFDQSVLMQYLWVPFLLISLLQTSTNIWQSNAWLSPLNRSGDFFFPVDVRGSVKLQTRSSFAFLPGVLVALWRSLHWDQGCVSWMTSSYFKILFVFLFGFAFRVFCVFIQSPSSSRKHRCSSVGGTHVNDAEAWGHSLPFLYLK